MSLGGIHSNLKGDIRKTTTNRVSIVDPTPVVYTKTDNKKSDDITDTTAIITLPSCGNLVYTSAQFILVTSIVGALWTMAVGLWWIKYYVECNQGVIQCN